MRLHHLLLSFCAAPLLTACVNDSASYLIDGNPDHSLTVIREQPYFWNDKVNLQLVVARMPDCMRRHQLGSGNERTQVEIWQAPSGAYIIRLGKRMYATEMQTCESFAPINGDPPGGMGDLKGVFRLRQGKWGFVEGAISGGNNRGD
ncbi:MAG: hypothetical protein LBV49_11065 [Azonexus sp.]|jgi:hypothetical protein|nr:hypothetical protein [Azonexus sp.]